MQFYETATNDENAKCANTNVWENIEMAGSANNWCLSFTDSRLSDKYYFIH